MIEKQFQNIFKELRTDKKMSQENMAKELNVSQSLINNWETGRSTPAPEMLIYIADYFDVSIDYLVGRTNEKLYYVFLANYFLASVRSLLCLPQPKRPMLFSLLTMKTSRKYVHWLNFTLEKSV